MADAHGHLARPRSQASGQSVNRSEHSPTSSEGCLATWVMAAAAPLDTFGSPGPMRKKKRAIPDEWAIVGQVMWAGLASCCADDDRDRRAECERTSCYAAGQLCGRNPPSPKAVTKHLGEGRRAVTG